MNEALHHFQGHLLFIHLNVSMETGVHHVVCMQPLYMRPLDTDVTENSFPNRCTNINE